MGRDSSSLPFEHGAISNGTTAGGGKNTDALSDPIEAPQATNPPSASGKQSGGNEYANRERKVASPSGYVCHPVLLSSGDVASSTSEEGVEDENPGGVRSLVVLSANMSPSVPDRRLLCFRAGGCGVFRSTSVFSLPGSPLPKMIQPQKKEKPRNISKPMWTYFAEHKYMVRLFD